MKSYKIGPQYWLFKFDLVIGLFILKLIEIIEIWWFFYGDIDKINT